ncbi:MAG: putative methyltransferase [Planctomycetaceae bacterium]|nr:putative methyltransferase [Planctomycetaceae bacterium]
MNGNSTNPIQSAPQRGIPTMVHRAFCPACGTASGPAIVQLPYDRPPIAAYLADFYRPYPSCDFGRLTAASFTLAECPRCACIYQLDVPDDAFLSDFYGALRTNESAGTSIDADHREQQVRELLMVIRFLQRDIARPKVLDFGCGGGNWALLAETLGLPTTATDLSDEAANRLRARGIEWISPFNIGDAWCDFINTEQVFEHLVNPQDIVRRLSQALRPGGILKIGVPHHPTLRAKLKKPDWTAQKSSPRSLNAVAPIEHLNHFESASLVALAARAGLKPLYPIGWELVPESGLRRHLTLKRRVALYLKRRLRDVYRPYHILTQTMFFRKH